MAPSDYIQARSSYDDDKITNNNDNDNDSDDNKQSFMVIVDERSYYPFLEMKINTNNDNDNDNNNIKNVVAKVLLSSSKSSKNHDDLNMNDMNIDEWDVNIVTGGITNKLYQVTSPMIGKLKASITAKANNNNNDSVLVRIFGGVGLIDRDIETSTFAALAKQGHAVNYYGRFSNGRIEDFCCNSLHTLDTSEMYDAHTYIAQSLALLHTNFIIPWELQPYHDINQPPTLWIQLESWWNQAILNLQNSTNSSTSCKLLNEEQLKEIQNLNLDILINEIIELRENYCK